VRNKLRTLRDGHLPSVACREIESTCRIFDNDTPGLPITM
jgi:hypothetical protein